MAKVWEQNKWYLFWRHYVDACTRTAFSSVTIEGLEKIPQDCPVVLAPNHCGALMDALLVLLTRKDAIAFGARYDIFKNAKVASVLNWLRILPMARERDGLQAVASNEQTFDEIVECIDHGVPFGIFSEGTHRAQRGMMPVKKGIFKIARRASEKLGKDVQVVPVGLDYEYFFHQCGRAIIRIGEPINVTDYLAAHPDSTDSENYRSLCAELQKRDLELIGSFKDEDVSMSVGRLIGGSIFTILSLPVFAACALISFPVWLTAEIILLRMKDKAWTHTVYFAVRFFLPVLWPFFNVYAWLLNSYRRLWKGFYNRFAKLS